MDATTQDGALLIAGRYALAEVLGQGSAGVVRRAIDRLLGVPVAVKSLSPGAMSPEPRIRREIAALRLLRLPGVVTLRDEIREGDQVHLVMDLVEGSEFPGANAERTWDSIGPLARSLLETLGRVHAAGVVHRDLKPGNVLVGEDGRVTVVDFGLSRGPSLSTVALTMTGAFVGTPQYMAPEQLGSGSIDGRTDLYSVGVMLYEALAGVLPIEGDNFGELARRKLSGSSVPLAQAAPHVPRSVAQAVDLLLCVHQDDRPRTAVDAIRRLFGEGSWVDSDSQLIWLGSREPLDRVLNAAREGKSVDIHGAPDSGRTRLLREVASTLADENKELSWAVLGRSPFASLADVLGDLSDISTLSREEAFETLDQRLRAALGGGLVILADDPDEVDPWSAAALERCRDSGSVVRVVTEATPGCVELQRFRATELEPLFLGAKRLLHLPTDAAEELWRRTGGHPSRVRSELAAWIRHGFAQQESDGVRVDRASLSRLHGGLPLSTAASADAARTGILKSEGLRVLLAWIALAWPHSTDEILATVVDRPTWMLEPEIELLIREDLVQRLDDGRLQPLVLPDVLQVWPDEARRAAHRVLAGAVPETAPERVRHLVAAGETEHLVAVAIAVGIALADDGRTQEACATLEQGLDAARDSDDGDGYAQLLHAYVNTCMSEGTPSAADEALYELDRAPLSTPDLTPLRELLVAVLERLRGDPSCALQLLDACAPQLDVALELWRQCHRIGAAERLSVDVHQRVHDEIGAWARDIDDQRALANHRTWSAVLVGRKSGPEAAVALHLEADNDNERETARMVALLNVGNVLLVSQRFDETESVARRVLLLAEACRHPLYEGYAESLLRDVHYRRREWGGPDLALVDAAAEIGSPQLEALIATTECSFAWRADRLDEARSLATRAATLWAAIGSRPLYLISRAMEIVCGDSVAPDEASALLDEAEEGADTAELAQFAGLLAPHAGPLAARAAALVRTAAASTPEDERDQIMEVISVGEALGRVATL